MKHRRIVAGVLLLAALMVLASASTASATSMLVVGSGPVNLGSTAGFAVLGLDVTNLGTSNVTGDLGSISPPSGSPITVNGNTIVGKSALTTAFVDLRAAFDDAWGRSYTETFTADLGGRTLLPGVYLDADPRPTTIDINGVLTLDAQGNPEAVWIFQSKSALALGANSQIRLINGARFCRVFWVVNSAQLGAGSHLEGHVFAWGDIDAGQGATVNGQLLAGANLEEEGTVNLNGNTIVNGPCTPRLPKTGYPPEKTTFPWGIAAAIAILAAAVVAPRLRASTRR